MMIFDFETGSDIDLKKQGHHKYITHPSTWVVMVAWIEVDDNGKSARYFADYNNLEPFYKALDRHSEVYAFNSAFEMGILHYVLGIDKYIRCVAILARLANMPLGIPSTMSLNSYCKYLEIGGKLESGARLMAKFSLGKQEVLENIQAEPDKYQLYKDYCIRDVELTYELLRFIPIREYDFFVHQKTLEMNRRGLNIDVELLDKICDIKDQEHERILKEVSRLTDGECTTPKQYLKLAEFLGVKSVAKTELPKIKPKCPTKKALVEVLKDASMGSLAKAPKIRDSIVDGKAHDFIEFAAAKTGRFGGRGLQIQNLPRTPYGEEDIEAIKQGKHGDPLITQGKQSLRGLIQEPMTVVDYASIENRMIAWLIRDTERLEIFRKGGDDYRALAAKIFDKPESEVSKHERTIAKPIVLGCMYGGGTKAIARSMGQYGLEFTAKELKQYLEIYNEMYEPLSLARSKLSTMLHNASLGREHMSAFRCDLKRVQVNGRYFLKVLKPSGTSLWYPDIRFEDGIVCGVNDSVYYGNLANNITQSCAADVLLDGIHKLYARNKKLLFTVHDEFIVEGHCLDELLEILSVPPAWCEDLPLDVEGDELIRYGKV